MRVKSVGKRRRALSATAPSLSAIPLLSDQYNATAYDTQSDDDDCIAHRSKLEPEPGQEPVDLLDRSICICCNTEGEEEGVLVCGERGCPVTVHANCVGSEPKFDDSGNFYCPYCWYKRAVDTCRQLREKAMIAKNALSAFLDTRADSGATPCKEHENPVRHRPSVSETEGLEREESFEDRIVEETESKGNKDEGKVSVTGSSVSETHDSESEAIPAKKRRDQKKVASVRKSLSREERKNHYTRGKVARGTNEEVTSSKTLRQAQRSPVQVMKWTSPTGKRKRLRWSAEEEKVLKEGVLKFSIENQNIPWRKILEFGCHVFDKTRTPVDLKDKWKNITSKEGCK
ncbi:hypothetical protein VNO77_02631 [Canavalia gladiata]|uniref:Myb-like domain-containing protein n=1 Tax=Canavalia gladiata TaxID=3824 RepID=A0AAN9MZU4_CANGL